MAAPTYSRPAVSGGEPVFHSRFRFMQPTLPELDQVLKIYRDVYNRGAITNGELVAAFEGAAAERLGVSHCIAVSSCTSGLMLVLKCLSVQGNVILPSFTFFATSHALRWNRLGPVFADCDPRTWTIDPDDVARKITAYTSAIVAVHLYGNPCAIEELQRISAANKLKLIFDAAHAFGSTYRGRPVGGFGDAEIFSLSPTKTLVSGEGGLIATNDAVLARRLRAARNYGDSGTYDCELLGLNARMSEFHAALGLAGLDLVDRKVARHNEIARRYTELVSRINGLEFQQVFPENVSTFKDYSVKVASDFCLSRDELAAALAVENIETRKYFSPPLHRQTLYRRFSTSGGLPNTDSISDGVLSLPIYESLDNDTVDKVAYAIRRIAAFRPDPTLCSPQSIHSNDA